MKFKAQVMDQAAFERTLVRIAHQILEKNNGGTSVCLVGINRRGTLLAHRLAKNIAAIEHVQVPVGELEILRADPTEASCAHTLQRRVLPEDLRGKTVVLTDDVIFTGRTARTALDAVMSAGQPARVQLFCMVDRGHAELPIKATFVGKNLPTSLREFVQVQLEESDGQTGISILEQEA